MGTIKKILFGFFLGGLTISVSWSQDRQRSGEEKKEVGRCIYVTSNPLQATLKCVQGDHIIFSGTTPTLLCDLVNKKYRIIVAQPGFEESRVTLEPKSGRVDTLSVTLRSTKVYKKSKSILWWSLLSAGATLAITSGVIYQTVSDNGQNKGRIAALEDLPKPPDRP